MKAKLLATILSERRFLITAIVSLFAYLASYLAAMQYLIVAPGATDSFVALQIVPGLQDLIFRQRATFLFEPIGAFYLGRLAVFLSVPNLVIGIVLGLLVAGNIAVSYYGFRALGVRGVRGMHALLGTIPALISGAACCVPTLMAQHAMKWEAGDVHTKTFWMDGVWAGLIAGVVFVMLEMFMVWAFKGESPGGPPHMIAAMVLGQGILPPAGAYAPFDIGILMAALAVHVPLSIVYGLIGAWIVHRFDLGWSLVVGAVLGWTIYIVNFLMIAPMMFPWFGMARGGISIFAHVIFGAVLTGSYILLRGRHQAPRST